MKPSNLLYLIEIAVGFCVIARNARLVINLAFVLELEVLVEYLLAVFAELTHGWHES